MNAELPGILPAMRNRVPTLTEILNLPELPLESSVVVPLLTAESQPEARDAPGTPPFAVASIEGLVASAPAEAMAAQAGLPPLRSDLPAPSAAEPQLGPADEERIAARVVADLQRRADQMLEYRLREALAPVLDRLAAQLVEEARAEMASTLRDVVTRAVSQEAARLRRQG